MLVIKGRISSPPLTSKNTLIELGVLQIKEDGSFTTANDLRILDGISNIHAVEKPGMSNQTTETTTKQFSNIFEGIGQIRDIRNDNDLYVQFVIKQNAAQTAQRPPPVLYYLQKVLKVWLEQCVENDIFEPVPADEPIT